MNDKKKKLTPKQEANRKKGVIKTEADSAQENQRLANDRARRREFFKGFNN
tara:strand:+ start:1194 stop:1346 length:153 start_codon:yes stop_codon:yes gene_type:complete